MRRRLYDKALRNASLSKPAISRLPTTVSGRLITRASCAISLIACSALSDLASSPVALNAGLFGLRKSRGSWPLKTSRSSSAVNGALA